MCPRKAGGYHVTIGQIEEGQPMHWSIKCDEEQLQLLADSLAEFMMEKAGINE